MQCLLAAIVFAVFYSTLGYDFVFDDETLIRQNPNVTEQRWSEIFGRGGYRPIRTFTYAVNYAMGGDDPFGYHLVNVLLHIVNCLLALALLKRLGLSKVGAFLGSLVFALHPVQTAAVAYISGRKDLLATLFLLAGLLAYSSWRRGGKSWRLVSSCVLVALAVLSKEVAVVFPVLFLLVDMAGQGQKPSSLARLRQAMARAPGSYIALGVLGVIATYYAVVWTQASRMVGYWGGSLSTQWATSFKLFAHYLALALWPSPLIADYSAGVFAVSRGFLEWQTLLCVGVVVGFVTTLVVASRLQPLPALGMAWFLVSLLPVLQIIGFHEIAADHFMYLPMFGVAVVLGWALQSLISNRSVTVLAWAGSSALLITYAFVTVQRNQVWANSRSLWEDTYRKAPGSYRANANLGQIYFAQYRNRGPGSDLNRTAIEMLLRAAELDPTKSLPLSNLGGIYRDSGLQALMAGDLNQAERLERKALEYLSRAIDVDSEDVWAYSNMGDARKDLALIAEKRGQVEQAATERILAHEAYESSIRIGSPNPGFSWVWFKWAMVHVDEKRFDRAIPKLEKVVDLRELASDPQVAFWMGYSYQATGRSSEAIPYLERAVSLSGAAMAMRLLGYALSHAGRPAEAIRVYEAAIARDPEAYLGYQLLGQALEERGDTEAARQHLQRALSLLGTGELSPPERTARRKIRSRLRSLNPPAPGGVSIQMARPGSDQD